MAFTAQEIIEIWDNTETDWAQFRNLWRSAGIYTMPSANNLMIPAKEAMASQGEEKTTRLTDTTSGDANKNLSSGLYAYLFPVNESPFSLVAVPDEANDDSTIAGAMSKITTAVQEQLANSDFPLQFLTFLEYFGCYGGACMYSERNKLNDGPTVVYRNISLLNIVAIENSSGVMDTILYRFTYTPRQAYLEWAKGKSQAGTEAILGKKLADKLLDIKKVNEPEDFIHIVYPRGDWIPGKSDDSGKPWKSQYVYVDDKTIVHEGGFHEMPYSLSWFWKNSDEQAGRGPGTEGLPEYRMVNRMVQTFIKGAEKQCDPPIFAPDDGALSPYRTDPSGIIFYRPGLGKDDFWALDTHADARLCMETIGLQRELIRSKFFNHLFRPLEDHRNMTATEAVERTQHDLRLLIPLGVSLQRGLLNSQIARTVGIMTRAGEFPFLEEISSDIQYKIEYQGRLALAIRELEGHAMTQAINVWTPYLTVDPTPLENINADKGFRSTMRSSGVPADWIKDAEVVQEERQTRLKAEQEAAQLEQIETAARAVKDAGKPTDESSPLAAITGGGG